MGFTRLLPKSLKAKLQAPARNHSIADCVHVNSHTQLASRGIAGVAEGKGAPVAEARIAQPSAAQWSFGFARFVGFQVQGMGKVGKVKR